MKKCERGRPKRCERQVGQEDFSSRRKRRRFFKSVNEKGHIIPFKRLADGVVRLSDLQTGQSATIVSLGCLGGGYRRRLLDMGMTRGTTVKIKKIAPLGDPVDIELRGYELCLRRCDMHNIFVKLV